MARMQRNSATKHPEASWAEPLERIAFLIRVIREIRGFRFGTRVNNLFLLPALIAGLNLLPAGRVTAQTFTTLYSFSAGNTNSSGIYTNSDGAGLYAGLITNSSGNTLYGTARGGGQFGKGTVFALSTDGSGFTILHSFTALVSNINGDGASPYAGLILSGNTLYGTASAGGSFAAGTVFSVNTGGTGFTVLRYFEPLLLEEFACTGDYDCSVELRSECAQCVSFPWGWRCLLRPGNCPSDTHGGYPYAGLILSGYTLYGTASGHGFLPGTPFAVDPGTVFAVDTDGARFRQLYGFGSDGSGPKAGLILSGDSLYGTTPGDGSSGAGTVFAVRTDVGFRIVHSFTNSDGTTPYGGLVLSGNTLYGTAWSGGSFGNGTVFAVNTDGTGFTNLHSFTGSDGTHPYAGLILSGNTLYGTASAGGSSSNGTVFAVNTDGSGFTNLHSFPALVSNTNSDGANPYAGLILSGNTLYGTASAGGSSGNGTVFSLSFRPQLTITPSGTNIILTWPTNVAGFDYTGYTLQSAPALTGTFTNLPAATSPNTNPIAGPQTFFRLISN